MTELTILKQELPVIEVNFEVVEKELKENLEQYKTFVVVDATLSACKEAQRGLAGLRTKVDTYRKDVKKKMSEPIAAFEEKCKQLVNLIEQAEAPLKEGIKVFDDEKREAKRQVALKIIAETIENNCMSKKYASQLTVIDKYMNLTAITKEVRDDIEQRSFILLSEQKREEENLELIKDAIDTVNKTIKKQLNISGYQILIDRGMSTKEIIQRVNSDAANIREAENPKPVELVEEAKPVEPVPQTPVIETLKEEPKKNDTLWWVNMKITATASQFAELKQYLLSHNITYVVDDKGQI